MFVFPDGTKRLQRKVGHQELSMLGVVAMVIERTMRTALAKRKEKLTAMNTRIKEISVPKIQFSCIRVVNVQANVDNVLEYVRTELTA